MNPPTGGSVFRFFKILPDCEEQGAVSQMRTSSSLPAIRELQVAPN